MIQYLNRNMEFIVLSNNVKVPLIGFGTYKVNDPVEGKRAILDAIKAGYRLFDTAQQYGNEKLVGEALSECGVPREELFITTKLHFKAFDNPIPRLEQSFKDLRTDYLDLVIIHWPFGNYYNAWRVLEDYYKKGKIRAIGVSNFEPGRLIDLIKNVEIKPMINQIEINAYCQRKEDIEWYKKFDVPLQAYSPLGHGSHPEMQQEEAVINAAKAHNKTPAQVLIRYITQQGISVIPKSSDEKRIKENFDTLDFSLSEEEMNAISKLDKKTPSVGRSEDPILVERLYAKND